MTQQAQNDFHEHEEERALTYADVVREDMVVFVARASASSSPRQIAA
jgi:hypothetical protein